MPFLLIMFLALACLPEVGYDWPRPPWIPNAIVGTLVSWLLVLLLVSWAWWSAQRTCHALRKDPANRDFLLRRYDRGRSRFQVALFVGYAAILCLAGWGWSVGQFWTWDGVQPRTALPGAELLILAPFFVTLVLGWVVFYDADRAYYLAAHHPTQFDPIAYALFDQESVPLVQPLSAPPLFSNRWTYVLVKFRHNLVLVLIPLGLLLALKEIFRLFPNLVSDWGGAVNLVALLLVGLVFLVLPWIIRLILNLRPLPEGQARQRLMQTARCLHFRCSDLLLWNTQGSMANAMVLGIFPWPRYVVFTDRMLEEFSPEEVEAVFGHEIGHVKHRHMLLYLVFISASIVMLTLLIAWLFPDLIKQEPLQVDAEDFLNLTNHQYLKAAPLLLVLLAYIFVVFGFLSRRCERQADVYGCRAASSDNRVTPLGIRIFISALEKVALVNGIPREKPGYLQSWQHSTIARRVAFLQRMLEDPLVEPRFQRGIFFVKCGLFAVLGIVVGLLTHLGVWNN